MILRTMDDLRGYQKTAVNFQCTHAATMMLLDPGLGKTISSLTSAIHLLTKGYLRGVLVVAPKRVCQLVWEQESKKWQHTQHLRFSRILGTQAQRWRALLRPADVYLINYENIEWLANILSDQFTKKGRAWPFDGVIWDEITKMKDSTSYRSSAAQKMTQMFKWRTGLTGTPASNGYQDLHGQYLILDNGERLGINKTQFRNRFQTKATEHKYAMIAGAEDQIRQLVGDMTISMSAADYNPLPDLLVNDMYIELPEKIRAKYEEVEREAFLRLEEAEHQNLPNQAAILMKCLQIANGTVLFDQGKFEIWHDEKLDALDELLEGCGGSVLMAYSFRADAERVMQRFKNCSPINLTNCKSMAELENAMKLWKSRKCKLMIGHPACLHPRTQVLTELRGWVSLIDVTPTDRVFDGVEFVNHDGCQYSGFKNVIDVFGITMTPDHKLLVNQQWVEAHDVRNTENSRERAIFRYEGSDTRLGEMFTMPSRDGDVRSKREKTQRLETNTLQQLRVGQVSHVDTHSDMENLARDEVQVERHHGQKLRRSWYLYVQVLGKVFKLLRGYASRVFGRNDHRTDQCEQTVPEKQLPLGDQHGATGQQTQQSKGAVSGRNHSSCGAMSSVRVQQNDVGHEIKSGDDRGSGSRGCEELALRERTTSETKSHVYDLVNCGPRHRFVIRNDDGEVFISHNSMGHGVDGLQEAGNTLAWLGVNWSLELYDQFNARLRRQGQGHPVICHRILASRTVDEVQVEALKMKSVTQEGFRSAIKQYRLEKGV